MKYFVEGNIYYFKIIVESKMGCWKLENNINNIWKDYW